mgnify:CR=1 FL=1
MILVHGDIRNIEMDMEFIMGAKLGVDNKYIRQ